ncbi:MAG: hypothetical protein JXB24_03235 [Bacteroidales bacterium]|nr:hypothetical protein [Bacteroidales bacterium]
MKFFYLQLILISSIIILINSCQKDDIDEDISFKEDTAGVFIDPRDNNSYKWIKIGEQIWMTENLRATKYADGTSIPKVEEKTDWAKLKTTDKAYCWYDNKSINANTYGALYTWPAVMNITSGEDISSKKVQGVCPNGWHVPNNEEWLELFDYLVENLYGYYGIGRDIAKSLADTSGWKYSDEPGDIGHDQTSNNSSGFSAVPAGKRRGYSDYNPEVYGEFYGDSLWSHWWSATESENTTNACHYYLGYCFDHVLSENYTYKSTGLCVRCVKD